VDNKAWINIDEGIDDLTISYNKIDQDTVGVPLRGHGPARHVSRYYGQWGGESHPEHLAPGSLLDLVETHAGTGWSEFNCHPGEVDGDLRSRFRYVMRNPVEAGLCHAPEAWRWSTYAATIGLAASHSFVDAGRILGSLHRFPELAIAQLRAFVEAV